MVSSAKYAKAERDLRASKGLASAATGVIKASEASLGDSPGRVVIAVSSDRGLCGGTHSTITKAIKPTLERDESASVFIIGDKVKGQLQGTYPKKIIGVFTDVGKKPPTFADACQVALKLLTNEIPFNKGEEFHLGISIFSAMIEGAASEQSARMQAMENATKNAEDMIGKLTLSYNRTRQAVITNELIEIISGAAAV